MTREEVVDLMKSSRSGDDWDANCVVVKAAHDGYYPRYWFEAFLESGLAREIMAGFGETPDITVVPAEAHDE